MPTTVEIPCPNCEKSLKVPDSVFGKKIKCKHCGHTFVVPDPDEQPGKPAKSVKPSKPGGTTAKAKPKDEPKEEPKPQPAPAAKTPLDDDDDDSATPNPFGVVEEKDVARCPHCAKELEPPDAIICVHCGFN